MKGKLLTRLIAKLSMEVECIPVTKNGELETLQLIYNWKIKDKTKKLRFSLHSDGCTVISGKWPFTSRDLKVLSKLSDYLFEEYWDK